MGLMGYFRAEPTEYARFSSGGKTKHEGHGISGVYTPFRTSIELVSMAVSEKPLLFREPTSDNQEVTLQGGILYRITDPGKVLGAYNFAIDPKTKAYLSEDPEKMRDHILETARTGVHRLVRGKSLEELLDMSEELSREVMAGLNDSLVIRGLGLEIRAVYFHAPQPQPDIAKALGAEYREGLLKRADGATCDRRAAAIEREKEIKMSELGGEVALEEEKKKLIDLQAGNAMAEAEYKADAAKLGLDAFEGLSPGMIAALALYKIGGGESRIESLSLTPELLAALRDAK